MAIQPDKLSSHKAADCIIVLFVPSVDREENSIDHTTWVTGGLKMLGALFGGATAFPQGRGVWRDDSRGGLLIFDEPTVIQCYTTDSLVEQHLDRVKNFLLEMGRETNQGAVGIVIDKVYYEIKLGGRT